AEEVRNLAQRAGEASRNTADLIKESTANAESGVSIAAETADALSAISGSAQKIGEMVSSISQASAEQSTGVEQVNEAVTQMDGVTQQNAATAEESASASEELSAQAEQLNQIVVELSAIVGGSQSVAMGGGMGHAFGGSKMGANRFAMPAKTRARGTKPAGSALDIPLESLVDNPSAEDLIPMESDEELTSF
ncbi:MAG: methyl-accepting chemotaxis protein, partial [bacterium]|nr:methyl-accepting chemotaxis protein [bacterium]